MTVFDDHEPTPAERAVAQSIDSLVHSLMSGELAGIAICAVNKDGEDAFFYLNTAAVSVLERPINKLLGLYKANQEFGKRVTAPKTNRSYRSH